MNHPFTGKELKQGGMQVAIDHANQKHDGWEEMAFDLLKQFLLTKNEAFLCEEFRRYAESEGELPPPPHARAYGPLFQRAKREKLLKHAGIAQVHNPKAHMANASLWIKSKVDA